MRFDPYKEKSIQVQLHKSGKSNAGKMLSNIIVLWLVALFEWTNQRTLLMEGVVMMFETVNHIVRPQRISTCSDIVHRTTSFNHLHWPLSMVIDELHNKGGHYVLMSMKVCRTNRPIKDLGSHSGRVVSTLVLNATTIRSSESRFEPHHWSVSLGKTLKSLSLLRPIYRQICLHSLRLTGFQSPE